MGILERMRLDGKVAFVTGGARGIGRALALGLAQAGAAVAVVDVDFEEAKKTAEEIRGAGVKATAIQTDVTDPAAVKAMVEQVVAEFGNLDIAFCNAGIGIHVPAEDMTPAQWQKVIDINLNGVFYTAQAAGRQMIAQGHGGSIVTTASMSGHIVNVPQPQSSYNASKAGVIQLTKSLAVEWVDKNIRVNSISPGYIGTKLTLETPALIPLIDQWKEMTPQRRLGTPEELQAIAVYLAGDASPFTTGADFIVDGGFTCI